MPNTMPASTNLLEAKANWPIPPTETPTVKMEKVEVTPKIAAIPHVMVLNKPQNNKPAEEKMYMGTTLPHLQKERRRYKGLEQLQTGKPAEEPLPPKPSTPPSL